MNEVAGDICVKDIAMLGDKGKLLELARVKLHERGYIYSKGKSRSRVLNPEATNQEKQKRQRIDQTERKHCIENLQDELKDLGKHITVKERRIEQAQTGMNFKLCDQLSDEISKLKAKKREVDTRLQVILHKEKQSKSYFDRKKSKQIQESEEVVPSHVHKKQSKDAVIIDSGSSSEESCFEERDVGIAKALPSNDEGTTPTSKIFFVNSTPCSHLQGVIQTICICI